MKGIIATVIGLTLWVIYVSYAFGADPTWVQDPKYSNIKYFTNLYTRQYDGVYMGPITSTHSLISDNSLLLNGYASSYFQPKGFTLFTSTPTTADCPPNNLVLYDDGADKWLVTNISGVMYKSPFQLLIPTVDSLWEASGGDLMLIAGASGSVGLWEINGDGNAQYNGTTDLDSLWQLTAGGNLQPI